MYIPAIIVCFALIAKATTLQSAPNFAGALEGKGAAIDDDLLGRLTVTDLLALNCTHVVHIDLHVTRHRRRYTFKYWWISSYATLKKFAGRHKTVVSTWLWRKHSPIVPFQLLTEHGTDMW